MSSLNFKPEQKSVLELEGKNQIISASAGSGKTTVMIQKIINLILEQKKNIKEILVLTYTKASADEMKQKLISALYGEAEKSKELTKQIDDIAVADISTIHSFFQKTIKKYFMALNINPSFVLLDENEELKLKNQAFEDTLVIFEQNNRLKFDNLIEIYGKTRNSSVIKNLVFEINKFLLALSNSNEWCEKTAVSLYQDIKNNDAIKILNEKIYFISKNFVEQLKKIQKIAQQVEDVNYIEYCNIYLSSLELVKKEENAFFANCEIWENLKNPARVMQSKKLDDLTTKFKFLQKQIKDYAEKIKKLNFSDKNKIEQELNETKLVVESLCELTLQFQKEYMILKEKNNVFDFDDLERKMLELVSDDEICEEIKNSYYKICVDEYQDANNIQEKILSKIANGINRFLVGDVKQSIYAFRLAEPDIFLDIQKQYEANENSEVQFLNCNFRSDKRVLDFINIVFSKIMTIKTGKIDYKNTSTLKGEAKYEKVLDQDIKPVEIMVIKKDEKEIKTQPTKIYSVLDATNQGDKFSDAKIEAFYVAKKINDLLGKKIYIAKENCEREIKYSDITILLRSRGTYLDDFCKVLNDFNIPLFANTNVSLYKDGDVELLLNLLKLVVNPRDDISLTSIMHSVFGGFTYDELAKIRLQNKNCKYFFECVDLYNIEDKIKEKISKLKLFLQDFEFDCSYLGIYEAYTKIISKYNFNSYILLKNNGLEKVEIVKKYVNDFLVNGYNNNIIGFLRFIEENRDNIKAPDYQGGENCVQITTIHSSKGLEYPIVFLVNSNQNFEKEKQSFEIKLNQKYGIGLKYYNKDKRILNSTLAFSAIKEINSRNNFAEKLRLLYVALTRAKNHLFIIGTTSGDFKSISNDFDVYQQKSYLQLIVGSLSQENINDINTNKQVEENDYRIEILPSEYDNDAIKNNGFVGGEGNPDIIKTLEQYFNFEYKGNTSVAIKTSVSELNNNSEYASRNFAPKKLLTDEHLIESSSEIGTAYHLVMEQINFDEVNSVEDVSNFLKNCEIDLVDKVNAEKIYKAIEVIKKLGDGRILKEQQFMMYVPHNQIVEDGADVKILVQGVIDLLILGKKNILVDYKFTKINDEQKIISKYKTQLSLYEMAVKNAINDEIDEIYLLLLSSGKLLKIK